MFIRNLNEQEKIIEVAIPLTKGKEKSRVKKRSALNQYGEHVATRRDPFTQGCYIEWQIGYDVKTSEEDDLNKTTLKEFTFEGANGFEKAFYELSEYIYYFYKWDIIKKQILEEIKDFLVSINEDNLLEVNVNYQIERSSFVPRNLFGLDFQYTQVKYPLLVYKVSPYEIVSEIMIREKQRAMGTQPMLYLCIPITEIYAKKTLLGRVADVKECGVFKITKDNIKVFLDILKIFGTLSRNHKKDILSIIDRILK